MAGILFVDKGVFSWIGLEFGEGILKVGSGLDAKLNEYRCQCLNPDFKTNA